MDIIQLVDFMSGGAVERLMKYMTIAAVPVLLLALVNCFFGYRLFRGMVGIAGFFIGGIACAGIYGALTWNASNELPGAGILLISFIAGAAIGGFLAYKLYLAGAFCMGFGTGMVLGIIVMKAMKIDSVLIGGMIAGLLMGLLSVDLYKHMMIIMTSVNGGIMASVAIAFIAKKEEPFFILGLGAVISFIGIIFQYVASLRNHKEYDEEEDEPVSRREKAAIKQGRKKEEKKEKRQKKRKDARSKKTASKRRKTAKRKSSEPGISERLKALIEKLKSRYYGEEEEYDEEPEAEIRQVKRKPEAKQAAGRIRETPKVSAAEKPAAKIAQPKVKPPADIEINLSGSKKTVIPEAEPYSAAVIKKAKPACDTEVDFLEESIINSTDSLLKEFAVDDIPPVILEDLDLEEQDNENTMVFVKTDIEDMLTKRALNSISIPVESTEEELADSIIEQTMKSLDL